MARWRDFAPGQTLPATWTDGIEELLSNYLSSNFNVSKASATTLQIVAGTGDDEVAAAIDGKPRWVTATVTAAHPGGAAGTYDVYIHANADSFGSAAGPPVQEVDNTNHNFFMKIIAGGGALSGAGTEAIGRKVATVGWDGAALTTFTPLVTMADGAQQAWQTIAFVGGALLVWTPANLSYYKDSLGIVRFRGESISNSSDVPTGTTLCTLPAGFRPGVKSYFGMLSINTSNTLRLVSVDTTGVVKAEAGVMQAANGPWTFSPVQFRAEN